MAAEWYARFADVPGVNYQTPPGIDRSRLKGASVRPTVTKGYEGTPSLTWETGNEWSSASPAQEHGDADISRYSMERLARHLSETLELPGELPDYHFAIQGVLGEVWSRRSEDPAAFDEIERLGWLDIELIRARPDAVSYIRDDERSYYEITAFWRLILIYEREGAWREALEVAEIAAQFGQQANKLEELQERVAALDAERAG